MRKMAPKRFFEWASERGVGIQVRPAWCVQKQQIALASWREVIAPLAINTGDSHTSSHISKGDQLR